MNLSAPATTLGLHQRQPLCIDVKEDHVHNSQSRPLFMCKNVMLPLHIMDPIVSCLLATARCISNAIA